MWHGPLTSSLSSASAATARGSIQGLKLPFKDRNMLRGSFFELDDHAGNAQHVKLAPNDLTAGYDANHFVQRTQNHFFYHLRNTTGVPAGFCVVLAYSFFMEKNARTSVLYNATCPLCNFEIEHYARYAGANDLPIRFDDLNSDARERWALDADTAARRLYVLHGGTLTSGIPAFLVLWAQMPRYRWLATVVGFPGIRQVASLAYDHVLAPAIYRWHLRRLRRHTAQAND